MLGQFPNEDSAGLVRRSWLERPAASWAAASPTEANSPADTVIAVDVGRDVDLSAAVVREGAIVRAVEAWAGGGDTMTTVGGVRELGARWGVAPEATYGSPSPYTSARGLLVLDVVGVGAGVHDRLREEGYEVVAFNAGSRPLGRIEGLEFANRRAETYWALREKPERGEIALPPDERLWDELLATRWSASSAGKLVIEPKDELRLRLGRSPDRADALAMSLASEVGVYSMGAAHVPI